MTIQDLEMANKFNLQTEVTSTRTEGRVILFHGTRASVQKILKEGLLIRAGRIGKDTKMQMIDEVLNGEFGVTREQVPEWIWRYDYDYEATFKPHLHMSINRDTAIGYSHQGCEIKACVRANMYNWLLTRRYGDVSQIFVEKKFPNVSVNQLACQRNGEESHVFQVEVPRMFLRKEDLDCWDKIKVKVQQNPKIARVLETTTLEVRCFQNIPPSMIKHIWKIHFTNFLQYEIEEVK